MTRPPIEAAYCVASDFFASCGCAPLVTLWEALPATASHQGAFDFPDASRSLFEAVAGMTDLLPLVRELEARLEADVESKDVDA